MSVHVGTMRANTVYSLIEGFEYACPYMRVSVFSCTFARSLRAVDLGDVAMVQFLSLNGVTSSPADITHAEDKWGSESDISRLLIGLTSPR